MGLILIICLFLNLAVIYLFNFLLFKCLIFVKERVFNKNSILNLPVLLIALPTICFSIVGSYFIFYQFFYAGYAGFGSYIWLPLIHNEIVLTKTPKGTLILLEEVDRSMGAAGGYRSNYRLQYNTVTDKREIEITTSSIYKSSESTVLLRENNLANQSIPSRGSGYNIYVNPANFTAEEFKEISTALKSNLLQIDNLLQKPREPINKAIQRIGTHPRIDKIYFTNRDSLSRNFKCSNGSTINVRPNGSVRVFFGNEVRRKNGAVLKDYLLGSITENGAHLKAWHNIESFGVDKKKLAMFNTVLNSCYDEKNSNFLSEYTFSQEVIKN
jgi:hypothetical protein